MANKYGVPEIRCRTAMGLLRNLDSLHKRWRKGVWLFRGQNNESWDLIPSAMRYPVFRHVFDRAEEMFETMKNVKFGGLFSNIALDEDDENRRRMFVAVQRALETSVIGSFANLAERAGLSVPSDHYFPLGGDIGEIMRQQFSHLIPGAELPPPEPKSVVFALGQHHGIPTRLMDWTFQPPVAAFFAAHEEEPLSEVPAHMVIWAIESSRLVTDTNLGFVTHQQSRIGFLQAQDGAFIYDKAADEKYVEFGHWLPFEYELSHLRDFGAVFKITLPFSKKVELLKLLRQKRIAPPYLKPSFDNVANDVLLGLDYWNNTDPDSQRFYK